MPLEWTEPLRRTSRGMSLTVDEPPRVAPVLAGSVRPRRPEHGMAWCRGWQGTGETRRKWIGRAATCSAESELGSERMARAPAGSWRVMLGAGRVRQEGQVRERLDDGSGLAGRPHLARRAKLESQRVTRARARAHGGLCWEREGQGRKGLAERAAGAEPDVPAPVMRKCGGGVAPARASRKAMTTSTGAHDRRWGRRG